MQKATPQSRKSTKKKSVFVLSTSPRKGGNSDLLADQFILGAQQTGHHIEKMYFKDKKIKYCTGCGTCLNGEKPCPQKDDMPEVLDKMAAADVIVLATPVYFYTMCAQMKTIIDRCCSRYNEIANKEFYFIVAAANPNKDAMERTIEGFRAFTSCLSKPQEKGIIYGVGALATGDIRKSETMEQAYEMGEKV